MLFRIVATVVLPVLVFLTACSVEPQPIQYGEDACHFCKMNIVDKQHAAEFVTVKGKVYKFDAIECMMNQKQEFDKKIAIYVVADYANPGELVDAITATYLKSRGIPSPMGGFLSAFQLKEDALQAQSEAGGEVFGWEELNSRFQN